MIPDANVRTVKSNGVMAGAEFGISLADSAHIMTILRDTLYSDKIMAVLREYSANAWDSHRTSGLKDKPIDVHIPTLEDSTLRIRDFGTGLSRNDVFNVYTQYGASTKRDQDMAVGMLGIGSKSGFAYSDTFTITSWHGGTKSSYCALLDPSDKGTISLINEEPCGTETGIMIEISVENNDIPEFKRKAQELYVHFDPRPKINVHIENLPAPLGKFKSGILFTQGDSYNASVTAVMGCVPYRVNLDQLRNFGNGVPQIMHSMKAVIYFNIGDVHINASREELKYSDKTKQAILDKMTEVIDEYVSTCIRHITSTSNTPWQKRLASQILRNFGDFIPKDSKVYGDTSVKLDKLPTVEIPGLVEKKMVDGKEEEFPVLAPLFYFSSGTKSYSRRSRFSGRTEKQNFQQTEWISVHQDARIVIRDTPRALKGYNLTSNDVIVNKGSTDPSNIEVEFELTKFLEAKEINGIPVVKFSELPWQKPESATGKIANPKYAELCFKYVPDVAWYVKKKSENWEIASRVPTDDDVYVEFEHFVVQYDFKEKYANDLKLMAEFGITMPDIWAYKVNKKHPSKVRKGKEYLVWRKEVLGAEILKHPQFVLKLSQYDWKTFNDQFNYYTVMDPTPTIKALGPDHMVSKFYRDASKARAAQKDIANINETVQQVQRLVGHAAIGDAHLTVQKRIDEIKEKYSLLKCQSVHFTKLIDPLEYKEWVTYIKMVDKQKDNP